MRTPPLRRAVVSAAALTSCWLSCLLPVDVVHAAAPPAAFPTPSNTEIEAVAAMLPRDPAGVGRPIGDRAAWTQAAQQPAFQDQLKQAQTFLDQPSPELPESLYNEFTTTGRRDTYEKLYRLRSTRLVAFVIAECIEDQGKYLPAIEAEIRTICDEKTWAVPAHQFGAHQMADGGKANIDLATAARAWTLATASYWLGDKLKPETRTLIFHEARRRMLDPYKESVKAGRAYWSWMVGRSNWNAVCTSGVVGTALTLLPDPAERAFFIKSAQSSMNEYLSSFGSEGYDDEGLGYWAYGFGSYLCLGETIYRATSGKLNLFEGAKVRQIALFPRHFEIMDGVFPAFGDSGVARAHGLDHVVDSGLLLFIRQRWGMNWPELDGLKNNVFATHPLGDRLFGFGLFGFPLPVYGGSVVAGSPAAPDENAQGNLRYFFKEASVLVSRSERPGAARLGFALKGGENLGGHGHNDNGTYVAVCNGEALVSDPGSDAYVAKTFGPHRFESMFMNSYGHDVPYVGGTLQKNGPAARGNVTRTEFTDDRDTLVMDLTSSYPVPALKSLTRTYVLDRTKPALEITDEASFSEPTAFGTALVTTWDWKEEGPGVFLLSHGNAAARATVTVDAGQIANKPEPVVGFMALPKTPPERLGVNVTTPAMHVVMHTRIVPVTGEHAGAKP